MPVEEELENPQGTRRPLVPKDIDIRVSQYGAKNELPKKAAYREIIGFVIDKEGNIKKDNIRT